MKIKNLLLTFLLVVTIALNSNAQTQLPNAGFENWDSISGVAENPVSWSSFNNFYNLGVPVMSFKTTDAHSGTYALRLITDTVTMGPPFGNNTLDTMAGFVFPGAVDFDNPGIPYADRPVLMQAWVKGNIAATSSAYIMITLSKWNTSTEGRDIVGQATYTLSDTISNYTQISEAINYSLPSIPDTIDVKIMAGDVGPGGYSMPGNEFFIDDISFTFPVGISEKGKDKNSVAIFPNPASDKITISSAEKINTIDIYNVLGEKIYQSSAISHWALVNQPMPNASMTIDLSSQPKGIYFVKLVLKDEEGRGEKNYTKKIVIQ